MLLVILVEGVKHLPRFLGGCGVVEVDKLHFAHPTIQDGKVFAHFPYVIHFSAPPAISNGPRLRAPDRPSPRGLPRRVQSRPTVVPIPARAKSESRPVASGILSNTTRQHPTSMPRSDRRREDYHEPHHYQRTGASGFLNERFSSN